MKDLGRPKKDNRKSNQYNLRLDANDVEMLEFIVRKTGESKAEVFRNGLKMKYNVAKYLD